LTQTSHEVITNYGACSVCLLACVFVMLLRKSTGCCGLNHRLSFHVTVCNNSQLSLSLLFFSFHLPLRKPLHSQRRRGKHFIKVEYMWSTVSRNGTLSNGTSEVKTGASQEHHFCFTKDQIPFPLNPILIIKKNVHIRFLFFFSYDLFLLFFTCVTITVFLHSSSFLSFWNIHNMLFDGGTCKMRGGCESRKQSTYFRFCFSPVHVCLSMCRRQSWRVCP